MSRPILVVAGARPNFMKVVPILHELDRRKISRLFVHTGQHYDVKMSEALLSDLGAPAPDVLLEVGSASHAVQTARVMERFEPVLLEHRPAWVVVVGDVNSTLACALVASKLREEVGCRIAHVEAGLRSNDWGMPEEVNRVLTDRLSDLLLTPSDDVEANLAREGLTDIRAEFVGNVMIDSLLGVLPKARELDVQARLGVRRGGYVLATLHRPSNVDDPVRLELLLSALATIGAAHPVVFPMHPRTRARAEGAGLERLLEALVVTEPLGYAEMVGMLDGALAAVTDSGGLQEETTVLGVPCVTVRAQTERPITVTQGTNRMVAWPPTVEGIVGDLRTAIAQERVAVGAKAPTGWDGRAAERIVSALLRA
ncbi:MAG: UDP-N-acetylglucosamine 2-epimerase (non-hydrolyzing) [Gemmatimonadaceae bacterium]